VSAEKNKQLVREFVDVIANGRQLSRIAEFLADDFRLPPGEAGLDRDGLGAVLEYYFKAFSDLHYSIEDLVGEGDTVLARLVMTATHDGEYDGVVGDGRRVCVEEVDIFTVRDGLIADYRIVWDELGFRRQLALPLT